MAKKKRKGKGGSGGAFGRSRGVRSAPVGRIASDPEDVRRVFRGWTPVERERYFAAICWEIESLGEDERIDHDRLGALVMAGEVEPKAHFEARELLEASHQIESDERFREVIDRVLEIDPNCVEAYIRLAHLSDDYESACAHYLEAITAGRRKREAAEADPSLPSSIRRILSRGLCLVLHEFADLMRLRGEFAEARALYEELLGLDSEDPRDARTGLLSVAFCLLELDAAEKLLEEMPPHSAASLYGRAFLAFLRALAAEPGFEPDMDSPQPFGKLRSPEMETARTALRLAFVASPWTVVFLLDRRSYLVESIPFFDEGSPDEALDCARQFYSFCTLTISPALWICSECGDWIDSVDRRRLRRLYGEFEATLDLLDEIDEEQIGKMGSDGGSDEFDRISEGIANVLLEAGAPRRNPRWR